MASRTIEARAVISAQDATGSVLDRIAAKFKGLEKNAKQLENIKPPRFVGDFNAELQRLKLTEKELQGVRDRRQKFMDDLRAQRPRAAHYFRANEEWIDREVNHWRRMKAGIDETAQAHNRWRRTMVSAAASVATRGAAMAGGVYGAYRVGRSGIEAAATSQRESARDYLAGMTDAESKRIEAEALSASRKYQSVDSQTMHERLRDTAMSTRSVDTAVQLSETIGQMTTVLQSLKGKDKAIEEGRKFFAALDVLGKNVNPAEIRELAHGYTKALGVEGADMDLGGVLTFARQSRAAGGILSNRFLMTTMPGLARDMGDAQLGTSLASALQQNVGNRATKEAMKAQRDFGLRNDAGFREQRLAMADPDKYAWSVLMPALQKKGVNVDDDLAVTQAMAKVFSNRTVQDVFSKLINQRKTYQGKAEQYDRAPGLDAGTGLISRDPFVAYEAVFAQLRTFAGQAPIMNAAADGLNNLSAGISSLNDAIKPGGWLFDFGKEAKARWETTKKEFEAIKDAGKKVLDFDKKTGIDPTWLGLGNNHRNYPAADDPMGRDYQAKQFHSKEYWDGIGRESSSASGAARLRREADAVRPVLSAPGVSQSMTWGTGVQNQSTVENSANVNVTGEVTGELEGTFKFVVDSSGLVSAVDEMKRLSADIRGRLRTLGGNGPGSTGLSSPDAQAPGGTGFGGGGL